MMKRCWAEILGGCSHKISREHYIGRELLQKVKTHGLHDDLEGHELPATSLKAHILCENHNSQLSDTDQEAINLHEGLLRWFENEEDVRKGNGFWTPTCININGALFSRWLCKFHCNLSTLKGIIPAEHYVRSAFGEKTDPEPRFYVRLHPGDSISYERRIWYSDHIIGRSKSDENALFHVYFMGLDFLVSPFALTDAIKSMLAEITGSQFYLGYWMEKPHKFVWKQGDIQTKSFVFDWESDGA